MHPKRLEIQQRLRWLVPVGIGLGALLVAGLWAAYLYKSSQAGDGPTPNVWDRPDVWLMLAAVATVAIPVAFLVSVRNYIWLIQHGTELAGRVVKVGGFSKQGSTPVTYAYHVGGVEYQVKRDTPTQMADEYEPGTPVLVLVDPKKPTRSTVIGLVG